MRASERPQMSEASEEAPAEERPRTACAPGERTERPAWPGNAMTAVRVDRRGAVGELVLARPERRNALDYAAVLELLDALRDLEADENVGAVLLYGEGRSFCAGGDLDEFQRGLTSSAYDFHRGGAGWADLMLAIRRMPKPVVVAPHGHGLAGRRGLDTPADCPM